MDKSPDPVLSIARRLVAIAKLPEPVYFERLEGGRNNQAFRVCFEDDSIRVLKLYHNDPCDTRDRLGAEWDFLSHVWQRNISLVPEPIVQDKETCAAFIEYIVGERRLAGNICKADIQQSADFIAAINATPRDVMALRPGSEACFSLGHHIATIDWRVERLKTLDRQAPFATEAAKLVNVNVIPAWRVSRSRILQQAAQAKIDIITELSESELCISPSDFGFHNALANPDGQLTFIDFEYAGRDDPAKLICDFLCQPEVPIPENLTTFAIDALSDALTLSEQERSRAAMLLSAYRIKWICIMMNEFLKVDAYRRDFASTKTREIRCAEQLIKVKTALLKCQNSYI